MKKIIFIEKNKFLLIKFFKYLKMYIYLFINKYN